MEDFKQLCEMIVERNGNPSCQDVIDCGLPMECFIIMAQSISTEKLLQKAKKYLQEMEVYI